ncbi:MAG: hypothetical protein ACREEA_06370, partial [Stellaceae bacterium]
LEVARGRDFPDGSTRHGYELVLPLLADGRIDEKTLKAAPELATVHRFWAGEGDAVGQVRHQRDGWLITYERGGPDDEPLHRFPEHKFQPGEYVSVRAHAEHAFKVVDVRPAPGLSVQKQ